MDKTCYILSNCCQTLSRALARLTPSCDFNFKVKIMIKVSVMYPNSSDANFNIDYYCNTHMPMVKGLLGDSVKGGNVDYGIAGGSPDELAPFIAIGHLLFESMESFQMSFGPHAEKIMADIPNYTNTQPQIQINEIKGE